MAADLVEFENELTRFALLANSEWIICILADEKPTVHQQKEVVSITGTELVKIHAVEHFKMLQVLKEVEPTRTEIDQRVIDRPNAFKGFKPEKLNKPIPVKFTPNIVVETKSEIVSTVFRNPKGEIYPMPANLPSDEMATLAKLVKATFVVARFEITFRYKELASPWRSQGDT